MNKTELIEEIAQRTDSSKAEAQKYMESFEEVVAGALRGGEEIQITGFREVLRPPTEGSGRRQPPD
jgi:DNA-binding protein HU-beta